MWKFIKYSLYPYIYPFRLRVACTIALSFLLASIGAAQARLIQPIFDKGINVTTPRSEVLILAGLLFGINVINFPVRFFHFYWISIIVYRAKCDLKEKIFSKIQRLPTSYFSESRTGEMLSVLIEDTGIFSNGFRAFIDLIRECFKAISYFSMAIYYDWQLTLVILCMSPFLLIIFDTTGKKIQKNQKKVQDKHGELTHHIEEGINGQRLIKSFNLQKYIVQRFVKFQNSYYNAQMKTSFVEELAHPLIEILGAFSFSLIVIFAHYRVVEGGISIGEFVGFIMAMALFIDPIRKLSQANIKFSQAKAAGKRISNVLEFKEEKDDGKINLSSFKEKIEIENLTFSYGDKKVFKGLNLTLYKGQKVGFVGPSGSGKSTLINLLLGLYPITEGKIKIDGQNINDISLLSLRNIFGFVGQDIFLFHDSIHENICLGRNCSKEEVEHAVKIAYADEFIEKLNDGINSNVGSGGSYFSGGQKQRITIARAFLQNAEILLFDEATSALDNQSEKIVQKAMEGITKDKTVIAVAHRLTTIQNYDKIFVFKDGRIIEEGKHEELMSRETQYKKLYELSIN